MGGMSRGRDDIPGGDSSIRGLVGRPHRGRGAADEGRRLARGYSFQIKRISPRASQERLSGGISCFPPDNPLETTKGRASALPLETIPKGTEDFHCEGRGMGAGRSRRFRAFRLVGGEVGESLVVLAPGLGGWGPAGDGGRHAESSSPTGGCGKPLRVPE